MHIGAKIGEFCAVAYTNGKRNAWLNVERSKRPGIEDDPWVRNPETRPPALPLVPLSELSAQSAVTSGTRNDALYVRVLRTGKIIHPVFGEVAGQALKFPQVPLGSSPFPLIPLRSHQNFLDGFDR